MTERQIQFSTNEIEQMPRSLLRGPYVITKSGIYIKNASEQVVKYLSELSTLRYCDDFTKKECYIKLHRFTEDSIIIPRFTCQKINIKTISQLKEGIDVNFKYAAELDDYQQEIYAYLKKTVYNEKTAEEGKAGCIIAMGAGTGKTYMAAKIMSRIKKKTAYIVHTKGMVDQAAADLTAALTVDGEAPSIGYYYSDKKIDGDVVIIVSKSAAHSSYEWNDVEISAVAFYNQFGLIVFDECQLYSNKTGISMYRAAQAPYMLGLSANPDENGIFDSIAELNIGKIIYPDNVVSLKPIVYNICVNRINYKPSRKYKGIEETSEGTFAYAATISKIIRDPHRNQLIIDCIKEALALDTYVYVFSVRRKHLMDLWDMVVEQIPSEKDSIAIMGGSPQEDMGRAVNESHIILTTYQYMGTGRSIRKMTAAVFAIGAASHLKQYIGRIHRRGSDPLLIRYIWDILDHNCGLTKQSHLRLEYYNKTHRDKIFNIQEERKVSYNKIKLYEKIPQEENDVW